MDFRRAFPGCAAVMVWLACIGGGMVAAQTGGSQGIPFLPELGEFAGPAASGNQITVSAELRAIADGTMGELSVTAKMAPGWHVYSITQKKGGPMPSSVELVPSPQYTLAGPFQPDRPPQVKSIEYFDVPAEEHYGTVTWTAPIKLSAGVDPQSLVISGKLKGQVCSETGGCIPLSTLGTEFQARYAGVTTKVVVGPAASQDTPSGAMGAVSDQEKRRTPPVEAPLVPMSEFAAAPTGGFRPGAVHATVSGRFVGQAARPGETIQLQVKMTPDPGWHIYAYAEQDPKLISKPTLIALTTPADWQATAASASHPPVVKQSGIPIEPEQRYHEREVTWTVPVTIPASASPGVQVVQGQIGYQTCTDASCDMPVGVMFAAEIRVGDSAVDVPLKFAKGKYTSAAAAAAGKPAPATPGSPVVGAPGSPAGGASFDLNRIEVAQAAERGMISILLLAFLGGFVLNFMPCVLPVIGLKVISFVQQAGKDRKKILTLNLWYSLGMLSIFWLLATLASAASLGISQTSLGWGEQFNYDGFTIPLLCVVFAMGLSFLGVWEIPIPGFVGTGQANKLAQKEGVSGAFFKGVVTTILATPCSGPGLATALTWSATKPPPLVYLVFTCMGLGMALPYLAIGVFPNLIRFLPKPGAWMDTFKQLMGFLLMGTVVYMFTLLNPDNVIPTLAFIFALWAACWWIGRTPLTANLGAKFYAWAGAAVFAGIVGWFAFGYEPDNHHELPWQPYSLATLDEHIKANRTVLVDFTADW